SSGTTLTTVVTDPAGNDTVHTFNDLSYSTRSVTLGCPTEMETKTQFYQGSQTSGSLLKAVVKDYTSPTASNGNVSSNFYPTRETTTWQNGSVTKTEWDYDTPGSPVTVLYDVTAGGYTAQAIYGKQVAERVFDYAQGTPGPILRTTNTAYMALSGPNSS